MSEVIFHFDLHIVAVMSSIDLNYGANYISGVIKYHVFFIAKTTQNIQAKTKLVFTRCILLSPGVSYCHKVYPIVNFDKTYKDLTICYLI